jgi:pimeloyl-ACP methyl ester carboxylesterase
MRPAERPGADDIDTELRTPAFEYEPEHHARDIEGLIAALELERPVLIGQSMGGLNALTYAAGGHASELAALVLVDVAPSVSQNGRQRIADFVLAPAELDSLEEFVERAKAFNPAARSACCAAVCSTTSASCPTAAGPGSTTAAIPPRRPSRRSAPACQA